MVILSIRKVNHVCNVSKHVLMWVFGPCMAYCDCPFLRHHLHRHFHIRWLLDRYLKFLLPMQSMTEDTIVRQKMVKKQGTLDMFVRWIIIIVIIKQYFSLKYLFNIIQFITKVIVSKHVSIRTPYCPFLRHHLRWFRNPLVFWIVPRGSSPTLRLHLSTHLEKETRYIQYGPLLFFQ
jgi:hypothetical protein